jgi:UDP-glucose 4-epimerase
MSYRGVPVVVTGGLGFIGSNLAVRLAEDGADVTIIDPAVPGCGANRHNIAPVADRVRVIEAGIGDLGDVDALRRAKVIFNMAGEISHIHSMEFPERDLLINSVSQLRFLQVVAEVNPAVRTVFASTRQIYGKPLYLPIDERHPLNPVDFNGVHKLAAGAYHLMLSRSGHLDAVILRLTNVYGPRMSLAIPCQGFLSTFLRRVLTGNGLEVFGDGAQLRDPVFVDDVVEAFLLAGSEPIHRDIRIFNIGGPAPLSLRQIAEICCRLGGDLPFGMRPFPADRAVIDIGSYYTDSTLIRSQLGWRPVTSFEDGIERTLAYYRSQMHHYLDPAKPHPTCELPEHQGVLHRLTYAAAV